MSAKKILVVDDDPDIQDVIALTFDSAGYETRVTGNGKTAYQEVAIFKPDVIILDVLLSGNDGRVICRYLKKNEETKNIPVIMISAHPKAAKSTKEAGADEFLSKPFDIQELVKKVENVAS